MLAALGLPANPKPGKCVEPTDVCDILGIGFCASGMYLFITIQRARLLADNAAVSPFPDHVDLGWI